MLRNSRGRRAFTLLRSIRPHIIRDKRKFASLRFVAESLGCDVGWGNGTRTITITYQS